MSYAQAATVGALTGASFGLALIAYMTARTVYTLTASRRWYQLKYL